MSTALQHARQARAHEQAAERHERQALDRYQQQMKAAGAEMFAAIKVLAKEADLPEPPSSPREYERYMQGRAGRELAQPVRTLLANLNQTAHGSGTRKDREWVKRITQWHTNPEAAQARREETAGRKARGRIAAAASRADVRPTVRNSTPRDGRTLGQGGGTTAVVTRREEAPALPARVRSTLEAARRVIEDIRELLPQVPESAQDEALAALMDVRSDLQGARRG